MESIINRYEVNDSRFDFNSNYRDKYNITIYRKKRFSAVIIEFEFPGSVASPYGLDFCC